MAPDSAAPLDQAVVTLAGSTLFGTYGGSPATGGGIYRVDVDGSNFALLKTFATISEGLPSVGLVLVWTNLYGAACIQVDNYRGMVFQIDTNGGGYRVLARFEGEPESQLVKVGDALYGVTCDWYMGGGRLFTIKPDGSGFATLHEFLDPYGYNSAYPRGNLVTDGTTLYGVTQFGHGNGDVYRFDTTGGGYSLIRIFGEGDGYQPHFGLAIWQSKLFGVNPNAVLPALGPSTLYSVNCDGTGFTILQNPRYQLWTTPVAWGTRLYGTAFDTSGTSLIFSANQDGTGFEALRSFGPDGPEPTGQLTLSGTTLYGTTRNHGVGSTNGEVFALTLAPPSLKAALSVDRKFRLEFKALARTSYEISSSTDPTGPWCAVTNIVAPDMEWVDYVEADTPSAAQRYYRVGCSP